MVIWTNNPKVLQEKPIENILFFDETMASLFARIRDAIHLGWVLRSHPLSGSVRPSETPFKSVLMEEGDTLDFDSLALIEAAIATEKKTRETRHYLLDEASRQDAMLVDLSLIQNAISR
ncbi:MAG TPA: glycine reductase [Tissierellia bacterium]|nr:glycine reductase [Tissierellia bacterium]